MPKRELSTAYVYNGSTYGPGETEIPQEVIDSENLTDAFREDLKEHPVRQSQKPSGKGK